MPGAWWTTISSSAPVSAEAVEVVADLARRADRGVGEHLVDVRAGPCGQQLVGLLVGDLRRAAPRPNRLDGPRPAHPLELLLAASAVSAAVTLTPAITYGCVQLRGRLELAAVGRDAGSRSAGAKCDANAYGSP